MSRSNLYIAFYLFVWILMPLSMLGQIETDVPPNAVPGKCYAKCLIPDQYKTVSEEVLIKEAASRLSVNDARFTLSLIHI